MAERVTITSEDGVVLSGVAHGVKKDRPTILLLHMMPATKESYAAFGEKLAVAGLGSLAIDFRGHGESRKTTGGRSLNYTEFSDVEHQAKIKDVEAAVRWLEMEYNLEGKRLGVVGASIGANLALQYLAAHPDVPAAVALSPGLNYRGVLTVPAIRALARDQAVYLAASREDGPSADAVEKLAEVSLAETETKMFDGAGHGTTMFEREPAFMAEVIEWLKRHVR